MTEMGRRGLGWSSGGARKEADGEDGDPGAGRGQASRGAGQEEEDRDGVSGSNPVKQGTLPHPSDAALRRPPGVHNLQQARAVDHRVAPSKAPEVHVIGELLGGEAFGTGVACRWRLEHGKFWGVLEGSTQGHTQTAYCPDGALAVWNHPIDVHYHATSVQGWPKIIVHVTKLDEYGRLGTVGYGFASLPTVPGCHDVTVNCWRPTGTKGDELRAFFLGDYPHLLDDDVIYHKATAFRNRLVTIPAGRVHLEINLMTRHFAAYGVDAP